MAVAAALRDPQYLRGLVDMGSNGIRFSISSLQPPTARVMPTLYAHRVAISLYDAQHDRATGASVPIDEQTIRSVVSSFMEFKRTCADFGVPPEHITVLATEATRTAKNSAEFRERIRSAVGWTVTMLSKEEEGRVGAMGIASSLPEVSGLVMDLGGGSTQLSWLIQDSESHSIQGPDAGAVSMPYGAAAMSQRLSTAQRDGTTTQLREEIQRSILKAYESLHVPSGLLAAAESEGGFTLYLSGGGFRGWGYMLMNQHHIAPYPIPVINGFRATREEFLNTLAVQAAAAQSLAATDDNNGEIFRISDRRASQVPAVAFLITVLASTLPLIKEVRFCQGGVREGYLFASLTPEIRAQHPLVVATQPFDNPATSRAVTTLLQAALPPAESHLKHPDHDRSSPSAVLTPAVLDAFSNVVYYHSSHSKELQAPAALRITTSGVLAGVHGVLHESRALIALLLCARWGDDVPPTDQDFKRRLELLVESPWIRWWIKYVGAIAAFVACVYPAGVASVSDPDRIVFTAKWSSDEERLPTLTLAVKMVPGFDHGLFTKELANIEKVGKKKNWINGRNGTGHRVRVEVTTAT